jgi:hypothetical protein
MSRKTIAIVRLFADRHRWRVCHCRQRLIVMVVTSPLLF